MSCKQLFTFREITNNISAAVKSISHYPGSSPQRFKDPFAAVSNSETTIIYSFERTSIDTSHQVLQIPYHIIDNFT